MAPPFFSEPNVPPFPLPPFSVPIACIFTLFRLTPMFSCSGDSLCGCTCPRPSLYNFHRVFDNDASQQHVYAVSVAPAVRSFIDGGGACIVARGTHQAGKSHTLFAVGEYCQSGCSVRAATDVLSAIKQGSSSISSSISSSGLQLYVSCLHIDSRGCVDLLKPTDGERLSSAALAAGAYSAQRITRVSDYMLILQRMARRPSSVPHHVLVTFKICSSSNNNISSSKGSSSQFLIFLETASEFSGSAHNRFVLFLNFFRCCCCC